jgi:hypothetical protein
MIARCSIRHCEIRLSVQTCRKLLIRHGDQTQHLQILQSHVTTRTSRCESSVSRVTVSPHLACLNRATGTLATKSAAAYMDSGACLEAITAEVRMDSRPCRGASACAILLGSLEPPRTNARWLREGPEAERKVRSPQYQLNFSVAVMIRSSILRGDLRAVTFRNRWISFGVRLSILEMSLGAWARHE